MKTAQKIKIIPLLLLLWALPMATLPRVTAKARGTAPSKTKTTSGNEAQLKMSATENYGKLPLSFERNQGQSAEAVKFLRLGRQTIASLIRLDRSDDPLNPRQPIRF